LARAVSASGAHGRPDVVHGLWAGVSGLAAVLAARRHRVPCVVSAAGGELVALRDIGYGGRLGRGGRMIATAALRGASAVTVASGWMAEHVRAAGYRVDDVVPLGVDTSVFTPRPGPRAPGPPRLVHVASLNRVKDQPTLLRAFAQMRGAHAGATLDVVGVDTLGGEVQRLAGSLGLAGAVHFAGYVPWPDLPERLRAADLHLVSSRHDAAPAAVLEAAACGLATVGTAVGHVTDLAALDPPGAVAVAPQDPSALAAAAVGVLADPVRQASLAAAALAWTRAHDADATAGRFSSLYAALRARR
jgi:glycosyltransferase involved in cell wall biosynthesis